MATVSAVKTGNWSDTSVWDTGAKPQSGDTVQAAGFTVTINEDVNIGAGTLTNTGGGGFALSGTRIITANVVAGTATCLTCSNTTLTVTGNFTGSSTTSNARALTNSTGTVSITGNVTGGSVAAGIIQTGAGTMTINGNAAGGSASNVYGVQNNSTGTVTINGNVTAGGAAGAYGAYNVSTGTVIVNGTVTPGSTGVAGVLNGSTGPLVVRALDYGADGFTPTSGRIKMLVHADNKVTMVDSAGGADIELTAGSGGVHMPRVRIGH